MLDALLVRLLALAFSLAGLAFVNTQVLDGALCLGTEGDRVVITEGCFLHDQVDLPMGSGDDIFGGTLDSAGRGPR